MEYSRELVLSAHQDILVDEAAVIDGSGEEDSLIVILQSISVNSLREPMNCCWTCLVEIPRLVVV
jgi:hypothetical protein